MIKVWKQPQVQVFYLITVFFFFLIINDKYLSLFSHITFFFVCFFIINYNYIKTVKQKKQTKIKYI